MKTQPLRFTPYAWAQYVTIRDAGNTEVGAYGITAEDDPLLVVALILPQQTVSVATVEVDGDALLDMTEALNEAGFPPHRWSRVWCHTHPGESAQPSGVDEVYFDGLDQEWSAMVILADGGDEYCRFAWNPKRGAPGACVSSIEVDYSREFEGSCQEKWLEEYKAKVTKQVFVRPKVTTAEPIKRSWWSNGAQMGQATVEAESNVEEYKCQDCDFDFLVDYDDEDVQDWEELYGCPQCKSDRTQPIYRTIPGQMLKGEYRYEGS